MTTSFEGRYRPRVLIVDGNVEAAMALAGSLEDFNCSAQVAGSDAQALAAGDRLRPQLVLLDIDTRPDGGLATSVRLRSRRWGRVVTIVGLTALSDAPTRQRIERAGLDGHLTKPLPSSKLFELVAALGGGRRAQDHDHQPTRPC